MSAMMGGDAGRHASGMGQETQELDVYLLQKGEKAQEYILL